ncbi:MAG TPA: hypothetical protein VHB68_09470 [Steroidobacteraceae bacterium]|nr:hypothetical protein [Steroidobacteraceae bacterium]
MTKRLRDPTTIDLQPLEADPRHQTIRAELTALETRYREALQRLAVAQARARGQQPTRSVLDRAKALVAGGQIISLAPGAEIEAATDEMSVLAVAIVQKREQLSALAAEISFEVCQRFAVQNAEALRAALDAVTALHQALEVGRTIRGQLIGAGYSLNDAALPTNMFPAAAVLGDPERVGMTPAALFKHWLADRGII